MRFWRARMPPKLWIYIVSLLILAEIKKTCGRFQGEMYPNMCNTGLHYWNNNDICKYFLPQPPTVSRFPYRMWEGKGQVHYLGRRNAELTCDFQQPGNVVSNVVWYKVGSTGPLLFEEGGRRLTRQPVRSLFRPHKMYALGRPGGSSLFIQDFSLRDAGRYRCLASRYALTPFSPYPQIYTVYKDIEFYPKFLDYEVFEG